MILIRKIIPCRVPSFYSTLYIITVYFNTRNKTVHGYFHRNIVAIHKCSNIYDTDSRRFGTNKWIIMEEGNVSTLPKIFSTALKGYMMR